MKSLGLTTRCRRFTAFFLLLFPAALVTCGTLVFGGEIHTAAQRGDAAKVKALLADSPDLVSSKDEHGWMPLYFAAGQGHKDVVEVLLAYHADVNATNQHFTALRAAVLNRHQDIADLLIANHAQPTVFDAAAGGYVDILKAMLTTDPSLAHVTDDSGWTPLAFGARNGQKDVIELLLSYKADANVKTKIGISPLQMALTFGGTPFSAGKARDANAEAISLLLIKNGADITSTNAGGMTALHFAAVGGLTNVITELLSRHADVNAKTTAGMTPMDVAAQNGRLDVVQLLQAQGGNMDAKDKEGLATMTDAKMGGGAVAARPAPSSHEYEVDGLVSETMTQYNGDAKHASASFTIYVRDCTWLIATSETNELGGRINREIGSTNGTEICECTYGAGGTWPTSGRIESNNIPVGEQDSVPFGHLWLMFASQCYWPALNSDQLTPIYDWRVSAGAAAAGMVNHQKLSADWTLLSGPGSLPREVVYLDMMNHTNARYSTKGFKTVGSTLVPDGFAFDQFNGTRLAKHVDVEVTAVRPGCSRAVLVPLPSKGTMVIDERIDSGIAGRPSSYGNPVFGQWLSVPEARELAGIRQSNTLSTLARLGVSPTVQSRPKLFEPEAENGIPTLELSIRCTNDVVKAGDAIGIEFKVTNRGTKDYRYANRTYDRSGRMQEYMLSATNGAGEAVADPRAKASGFWMMGGLFSYSTLSPGQSFTKIIPLNRWALIKDAGDYIVVARYGSAYSGTNSVTLISDPIHISVLPRTPQEMDAYISGLTNRLEALLTGQANPAVNESRPPDPAMNDLVTKLMFTCNPKIVPALLDSMADYGSGGGFWEREALTYYVPQSEETRQAILAAARSRGLARNWTLASLLQENDFTAAEVKPLITVALAPDNEAGWPVGAQLAQKFGDDSFTERLAAIARLPRNEAQIAAISALGAHRSDEGVKTLKSLLDDPHERIWVPLAQALLNGSRKGTFKEGDFTAEDFKPLVRRMLSTENSAANASTGISLLQQFGGDDFMPQLIALATNTNQFDWQGAVYALARNRTDDGVKTIKSLLSSSNPSTREVAEDAVRSAYLSRDNSHGRPLRPDDFDQQYQHPKPDAKTP